MLPRSQLNQPASTFKPRAVPRLAHNLKAFPRTLPPLPMLQASPLLHLLQTRSQASGLQPRPIILPTSPASVVVCSMHQPHRARVRPRQDSHHLHSVSGRLRRVSLHRVLQHSVVLVSHRNRMGILTYSRQTHNQALSSANLSPKRPSKPTCLVLRLPHRKIIHSESPNRRLPICLVTYSPLRLPQLHSIHSPI